MKRVLAVLVGLVLLAIVVVIGGLLLLNPDRFRPQLQATLGDALGRPVRLGTLHVAVFDGSLKADDIRIADDQAFGSEPFVTAHSLSLGVRLWPLLIHRQLRITSLTLEQPQVILKQNPDGSWNFASFGAARPQTPGKAASTASTDPSAVPDFSVDRLSIHDGRIDLRRAAGDTRRYSAVQLSAQHVGIGAAFPLSMSAALAGGGTLQLDGTLGPWTSGDALRTPVNLHLVMHGLDLVATGLMSHGDDVGGVLDIDTRIQSDKGILSAKGKIDAHRLQLVAAGSPSSQPVTIAYQIEYDLGSGRGLFTQTTLGSGHAQLALQGSFDNRPKVMQLNLQLSGKQLPVNDLQPLLPAFGVVLPKDSRLSGGRIGVGLTLRGPLDALVISGPVTLDDSRLVGYSLGGNLGSVLSLAGIQAPRDTVIKHLQAALRMDPGGLAANPFSATVASLGDVSGRGSMATNGRLDARMLVKLDSSITGSAQSGKGLAGLLGDSKTGRLLGGVLIGVNSSGVGVRVSGTASEPRFKVDPAVARLLKSGLSNGQQPAIRPTSARKTGKSSRKNALQDLLKGVLK
ncbi:MAG: AsmA family protein [Rhodanobacter sp.]